MTKQEYIERLPNEVKIVSRNTANKLNLQRLKISAVVATNADGKDYIQRKMTKKQLEDLLLDVYHHIKSEIDTHQQVARAMTSLNAMS